MKYSITASIYRNGTEEFLYERNVHLDARNYEDVVPNATKILEAIYEDHNFEFINIWDAKENPEGVIHNILRMDCGGKFIFDKNPILAYTDPIDYSKYPTLKDINPSHT